MMVMEEEKKEETGVEILSKRKRRPPGTPDPDAEVVSLSPRRLMESERYVCEICKQWFLREQNLRMHKRQHKVDEWKLKGNNISVPRKKKVYVCPEATCLHHHASHALGDLVGIKKHFRRKHSSVRQWLCSKCSKTYAVHSDFKAHLKKCGTRGHSCHCGRVFSRVESFIEHQNACNTQVVASLTQTTTNQNNNNGHNGLFLEERDNHNLELQLSICNFNKEIDILDNREELVGLSLKEGETQEELVRQASSDKAYADEARREAKLQMERAEREFANAKRIRQNALAELDKALMLKDYASNRIKETLLEITCHVCKMQLEPSDHLLFPKPDSRVPRPQPDYPNSTCCLKDNVAN